MQIKGHKTEVDFKFS